MIELDSRILSLRLFGSVARGDHDHLSDLDILVVVDSDGGKVDDTPIVRLAIERFGKEPSISWYGHRRYLSMHDEGHLFTWHIYAESVSLGPPADDFVADLGKPRPYRSALTDIESFEDIAASVPDALLRCPRNAIYEAGLLYVCARNIAMAGSWDSMQGADYRRFAPYNLARLAGSSLPWPVDWYENFLACRIRGLRGLSCPEIKLENVLEAQKALLEWTPKVTALAKERSNA